MATDSIISEVRQAREELAKRCNFDLRAMIQGAKERQASGGRRIVTFRPKPVRKPTGTPPPSQRTQPTGVADEGLAPMEHR
jgi:hypothetical protein